MTELMYSGVELAILGMGTVFIFLGVLVAATMTMSRIVLSMAPVPVAPPPSVQAPAGTDRRLIAAIGAAVERYRADHER